MSRKNALLRLASEQGQLTQVIESILDTMGAHPDLIDLPRMVTGLLRALRAAGIGNPIWFKGCDPVVWREACEWLIELRLQPRASSLLGEQFWLGEAAPSRNPVLNKGVKQFGFPYAALWHVPSDTENTQDYERLLAQLLVATQQQGSDHLYQQRYAVFLDLRRLCTLRYCAIPPELNVWGTAESFLAGSRLFSPSESRSEDAELFAAISRLVRYSHGEEPLTRPGGGGSRGRRPKQGQPELTYFISEDPRGFVLGDPDDPDQLPGRYNILTESTDSHEGELAPDELSPSVEIWVLDDDGSERPYVADKLSRQGIEAHIVRSRQLLPFAYSQFTLAELRDLLFGASDLFEACQQELLHARDPARVQLRIEAILLLHISLWLGQATVQIVQLTVMDNEDKDVDGLALIRGEPAQFSMIVRRPELAGDDRWQATAGIRPSLLRILLPDLAGSSSLIDALLRAFPRSSSQIFTYQTSELEAEAKAVLAELGKSNPRFTLTKVRNYLFHQLVSDTHDVAAASMLSGVSVPSAQTPRYYLQLDTNHLRRIYVDSLQLVLQQVYACAGLAYEPVGIKQVQRGAVGATHCLLPETIAANVSALAGVLRKKPTGRLSEMLTWHNYYTLWVVQMFMLSTGCRAIRNPLRYIDEFEPALGMGAMSDKDSDDRHMSRLVCMPPMLQRQLAQYRMHCEAITRQMIGYLPRDDGSNGWSRGFFLSLSDSGIRRVEIRPATIRQQMEQVVGYTPNRINAYRKFLRTELSERGCPAEAMSAFMGHWLRGEEPQDTYSSFCPATYARVIDEWVTPLLKELGWCALGSPWGVE
ncbi:hypothetical protein ACFOJE_13640 [Azotobacter bryophylli]|uniref:Site-specific integrase n=1 Tax=Azotobacter bryophylli TaxID=1986537 RepID=A0ABV7AXJ2_9GAMM